MLPTRPELRYLILRYLVSADILDVEVVVVLGELMQGRLQPNDGRQQLVGQPQHKHRSAQKGQYSQGK